MSTLSDAKSIIALDVGERRIGVARAGVVARLPEPLSTLSNDSSVWTNLKKIMSEQNADVIVIGLPRSLNGNDTLQTGNTRKFAETLNKKLKTPVYLQDEALTSSLAVKKLESRGKNFDKEEIDSTAAAIILEDFLRSS